jgi:hypothetical protein
MSINWPALIVLVVLFAIVTVMGEDGRPVADQPGDADRGVHPEPGTATGRMRRWRSVLPSRCSCTRTASPPG